MKSIFLSGILAFILCSCSSSVHMMHTAIPTKPVYNVSPEKLIALHTVNVPAQNYRSNKEELFLSILDSCVMTLSREASMRINIDAIPIVGITKLSLEGESGDNELKELITSKGATDAIVITDFDVYFSQVRVDVTRNDDGSKSREAYYDIISTMDYAWYTTEGLFKREKIEISRTHSSRSVLSGLLAAGPNIVSNSEDAIILIRENLNDYLNKYLPGFSPRMRPLFVGKPFVNLSTMITAKDYERALSHCQRYTEDPDKKIAARASYNCAVLLEGMNRHSEVLNYLEQSLRNFHLAEAWSMKQDY